MENKKNLDRFFTFFLIVLLEILIFALSLILIYYVNQNYYFSSFVNFLFFFFLQSIFSIILMRLIQLFYKTKPGIYTLKRYPKVYDVYMTYLFLYLFNLGFYWQTNFPGVVTRRPLYKILGCKQDKTSLLQFAKVYDPLFIEIGKSSLVGAETILTGHALTLIKGEATLLIGKIIIGDNSLIGAGCIIMPDVIIGENCVIRAGSYIPMNARIPSNEVWGGNPAIKIGDN